jgi:hypothetical protein
MKESAMRSSSLFAVSLALCLAAPLAAQQPPPPPSAPPPPLADSEGPPSRVARISYVQGEVSFQPSGDTAWSMATVNYPVTTGDRLYTDTAARVELQVGALAVRLGPSSDFTMTNLTEQLVQLGLAQGTARVTIYSMAPGDSVELDTQRGALFLLQPGTYRVDAPEGGDAMIVTVEHGSLQWTAGGVAQSVADGQAIQVSGINPIQVASLAPALPDDFDRWCDMRDHRASVSPSAQYVSRDIPGYDDLDDYGYWRSEPEYGPVWYPTAVPTGWVPYRFGHWVWIEPWGWTWVEHERWGYAPFHYGRWVQVGPRWGWLPGPVTNRPYYAPALVVFVGGGSFDAGVQAWFPLGPGEPYHPWFHHDDLYLRRVNVVVRNERHFDDPRFIDQVRYRNREVATTAVQTTIFQSGQPIGRRAIPVGRDQALRGTILAHPMVAPAPSAARGGVPAVGTPMRRRPDFVTARPPQRPTPAGPTPVVVPRTVPAPIRGTEPPLITRRSPPPQVLPFQQRRQAMQPDAGRPLEPQQIQNLRTGKPAGPRRDPEYPPHPAPATRAAPKAQPSAAPAHKGGRRKPGQPE